MYTAGREQLQNFLIFYTTHGRVRLQYFLPPKI